MDQTKNSKKWNNKFFMTREQIRTYDKIAIEKYQIGGSVLMENAGRGAALHILQMSERSGKIGIISGPGNNGGDGFVIARHLINSGLRVKTFVAVQETAIKNDALKNYTILKNMDADIINISQNSDSFFEEINSCSLIIDALLGTGVNRNIEGYLLKILKDINRSNIPIVAIDIPSGLDADTGTDWGMAITARETITFGHIKKALLTSQNAYKAGNIKVVPIGVPAKVSFEAGVDGLILDDDYVKKLLPARKITAHKGDMGHLVIVAGTEGKSGSAVLASNAALKTGTGLVTIATTQKASLAIEAKCLEVMVTSIIEKPDAPLTEKIINNISKHMEGKSAVALGPGLTTAPGISMLVMKFLQSLTIPAVIDADGINILAADPSGTGRITTPMVFTPHPGEMARLLSISTAQVQADRTGTARKAASWHKAVVVLKGYHTVIASPDGDVFINPTGNAGMATAGTGDTLTGMIGSFLAQGVTPLNAALLGTYIHGKAADTAIEQTGMTALVASDIIKYLPEILRTWES